MIGMSSVGAMATGSLLSTLGDIGGKAVSVGKEIKDIGARVQQGSLSSLTSVARVEPLVVVDSSCLHIDFLPDVMQSLQSVFTGYYLQAVSLTADVNNVKVAKVLDKLNPSRNPDVFAFLKDAGQAWSLSQEALADNTNWKLAYESYRWRLPVEGNLPAMEAEAEVLTRSAVISDKTAATIADIANLSVGKLVNVEIKTDNHTLILPVAIRLLASDMPSSSVIKLMLSGTQNNSFTERYYKWRAGRIEFVRDLILCQDLIKEHKKAIYNDKNGTFTEIMRRAKDNKLSAYMSKQPSLAAASNMYVISEATAQQMRTESGIDLDNFSDRQKIFDTTYGMIITVVDPEFRRVRFYHRDIRLPSSVGAQDIKGNQKGGGPDIMDILNAYKKGESPSL